MVMVPVQMEPACLYMRGKKDCLKIVNTEKYIEPARSWKIKDVLPAYILFRVQNPCIHEHKKCSSAITNKNPLFLRRGMFYKAFEVF
jgi:hypothetical protein